MAPHVGRLESRWMRVGCSPMTLLFLSLWQSDGCRFGDRGLDFEDLGVGDRVAYQLADERDGPSRHAVHMRRLTE